MQPTSDSRCAPFAIKYNGRELLDILDHKAHAVFFPQPDRPPPPKVEYGTLYDQMLAARAYGFEVFSRASKDDRALMIAEMWASSLLNSMRTFDMKPPPST